MSELSILCKEVGISITSYYEGTSTWDDLHNRFDWSCELSLDSRKMKVEYHTGLGNSKIAFPWKQIENGYLWNNSLQQKVKHYSLKAIEWKAINPIPPEVADVVYSLAIDADALEYVFSDWCSNLGYDEDSIKAKKIYDACIEIGIRFKQFLRSEELFNKIRGTEH